MPTVQSRTRPFILITRDIKVFQELAASLAAAQYCHGYLSQIHFFSMYFNGEGAFRNTHRSVATPSVV